ncbi:MAG TPA: transcription elongation factor GreB [Stellaceae bacterium]|jgi:transcription elongation factor GreB|nr:transcription elongation factor GreB [Stellaceae bacterium]
MSKAFTKEDTETDDEPPDEPQAALPAGTKNYITPAGFRRMQDELKHLQSTERPKIVDIVAWAAGNGDRSENGDYIYGKQRLREIDRRCRFLLKRLEAAEIVDPARQAHLDCVFFGATVTYATKAGDERTITIVGVDEVDADNGRVSWISPVARALMKAQEGDVVELRTPHGPEPIEVVEIRYGG